MSFTAGYVTDFRFFNIGAGGFGEHGLNYIFDNVPDEPIRDKLDRPDIVLDKPMIPTFDGYQFGTYYGSHVGTNRWWQLPFLTFSRGAERIPFYPSIMESDDEEEVLLVDLSTRVTERTLAYLDGQRSAGEVARALQQDFGGFDQKIHRSAMKFMDNLLTVGLLRVADEPSA